ncbi:hypothetical protein GCM10022198_22150 [Klugiella xanthotipulae]|uniref:Uncharacterized protein n=1 Tax=Klugiella xanthotipulae TaxID=244735 RepID=A0A543HYB6_9MICO|nr:hypothetical protein [Klugiella xanthotipulae]TQM63299.1 hypothetical protein FB466_1557 [Klugiella xanthotipulae]
MGIFDSARNLFSRQDPTTGEPRRAGRGRQTPDTESVGDATQQVRDFADDASTSTHDFSEEMSELIQVGITTAGEGLETFLTRQHDDTTDISEERVETSQSSVTYVGPEQDVAYFTSPDGDADEYTMSDSDVRFYTEDDGDTIP